MNRTKNIIITLLIIFLGSSLYFNFNWDKSVNPKVSNGETAKISSESLFQKKQECQQYEAGVVKKLKELDFYNPDTKYQTANFLEKLFFSPMANTCLYVAKEWGFVDKKITYETLTLNDALTGEMLTSSFREMGSREYLQQKQGFEAYLKDYE